MRSIYIKTLLIGCISFWLNSCEKDDICIAGDTPLLHIGFYASDDLSSKQPTDLVIIGYGKETKLPLEKYSSDGYELLVPLNASQEQSSYYFIRNALENTDGSYSGEIDLIDIDYTLKAVFISKACGYIPNFENLNVTQNTQSDGWISSIEISNNSLTNSDDIHVKIYH